MTGLNDAVSRKYGVYRADFNGMDLGELALPPEIHTDCEIIKMAVQDDNAPAGYDEISNVPRLSGRVKLSLFAGDAIWLLVAENNGIAGKLTLHPDQGTICGMLIFPAAYLLPRWEFIPTAAGAHTLTIHLQLKSDAAGKIFYYQI